MKPRKLSKHEQKEFKKVEQDFKAFAKLLSNENSVRLLATAINGALNGMRNARNLQN